LLAFNALVLTLLLAAVAGAFLYFWFGRPFLRRIDEACKARDARDEAREVQAKLDREEEARLRAQSERELEELASMPPVTPEKNLDETL